MHKNKNDKGKERKYSAIVQVYTSTLGPGHLDNHVSTRPVTCDGYSCILTHLLLSYHITNPLKFMLSTRSDSYSGNFFINHILDAPGSITIALRRTAYMVIIQQPLRKSSEKGFYWQCLLPNRIMSFGRYYTGNCA